MSLANGHSDHHPGGVPLTPLSSSRPSSSAALLSDATNHPVAELPSPSPSQPSPSFAAASADPLDDASAPSSPSSLSPSLQHDRAWGSRCCPSVSDLRERVHSSVLVSEAIALRPLFDEAARATAAALSSFCLSTALIAQDFVVSSPARLRSSAVSFYHHPAQLRLELLLGVSLSALLVVDAIAFSVLAGVQPISGLYACFILTLFTSVLGGCPGMVSGAAGSTTAVQASIVATSGVFAHLPPDERLQLLFLTLLLAGCLEVLVGALGLAELAIIIPVPVFVGFLNGLAVIILQSQLAAFQLCPSSSTFTDCTTDQRQWLPPDQLTTWLTALHLLLALLLMQSVHRLPIPHIKAVPAVLIVAFVGCCVEHGIFRAALDRPTRTVKETAAINGELPSFSFPTAPSSLSSSDVGQVLLQSVLIAFVGLVESILTLQALNVTKQRLSTARDFNTESVAQGVGNVACGLLGALGGCALVGESSLNVTAGSRSRLSTFTAAWCIAIFIVGLYDVVNLLPIATVAGVMVSIVLGMFQWHTTFAGVLRLRVSDWLTIAATTVVSVVVNLGIGVLVGIALQTLVFAWDMRRGDNFVVKASWMDMEQRSARPAASVQRLHSGSPQAGSEASNGHHPPADEASAVEVVIDAEVRVQVRGVLYFGSVASLLSSCHPDALASATSSPFIAPSSPTSSTPPAATPALAAARVRLELDLHSCRVLDYSGCCAVDDVLKEWRSRGWAVQVSGLDEAQRRLMQRIRPITPSKQPL